LFEPDENSAHLAELEIEEGLLEIQTTKRPYVIISVKNNTKHSVTISVARVIAINPLASSRPRVEVVVSTTKTPAAQTVSALWQPPVDLGHLSDEEQEKMLWEESAVFAQDSHDIGCIPSLQMSITLKDEIPVQRLNSSSPNHCSKR